MDFIWWASSVATVVLSISLILAITRVVLGPTLPNRAMAIDLIASIVICLMAVSSLRSKQEIYLEVVIVWALLSFIGIVAFVNFLEKRMKSK